MSPRPTLHIAFNIDERYVCQCSVTLLSILTNNTDYSIHAHIVTDGLSEESRQTLLDIARPAHAEVSFYTIDPRQVEVFRITAFGHRISMATYYRCLLSDLLPSALSRVLYLDCDIIVRRSLHDLWQTDLTEKAAAVIRDIGADNPDRYERLQYPAALSYFNAGVMLINLDYWREHRVAEACVTYYTRYPERILLNDQDLLNAVLQPNLLYVHLTWNCQDGYYRRTYAEQHQPLSADTLHTLRNPAVLHYTNRKPWEYDSLHPLRKEYFKYLDLTPWRGQRILHNPFYVLLRFFRLLPFTLKLRKDKYMKL